MRKMIWIVVAVVVFMFPVVSPAQEITETGDKGEFEYPCLGTEFCVWNKIESTGARTTNLNGEITPATKVRVINRNISIENLDLLSGRNVLAYGKFRIVGTDENTRTICDELNIFILPK
jgi:hypothetical protein